MTSTASQFTGTIPEHYDRGLGPVLFAPFADDIARRAAGQVKKVLELAAGTGIVTRALCDALPAASITVTDLNAAMLDVAARKFEPDERVAFQPADAMNLPFPNATFDLIVCQFGVMFFPDKAASFREARRVLKPAGRYVFNVWGPMEANPFSALVYDTGAKMFPRSPPGFYRVPFSYADTAQVAADAGAGGFADVQWTSTEITQIVADWPAFADGLVRGNPVIAEIEQQDPSGPDKFMAAVIAALRARFGNEPAEMPLQAFVFTCR